MNGKLHLNVFNSENTSSALFTFDAERNDIVWLASGNAFWIRPLRWWDDDSYADYQARDIDDRDEAELGESAAMDAVAAFDAQFQTREERFKFALASLAEMNLDDDNIPF